MTENPNFADLLDKAPSEEDRPKPLPPGSYVVQVQGMPQQSKSQQKNTPFLKFTLRVISAGDDVDEDAIEEMGGVVGKTITTTFYLTEQSIFRLNDFLSHCGLEFDGSSRKQLIDKTPNCQLVAFVKHRPSSDGSAIFAEVDRTAPLD